jgi:hypothetical protein
MDLRSQSAKSASIHSLPRHLLQAQTPCTGSELHGRCVVI